MHVEKINEKFGLQNLLCFEETPTGLIRAHITAPSAEATIYLQGAHLTHWQPATAPPVLFMGSQNDFAVGGAIRGGVPVIFPWFSTYTGPGKAGQQHPFHGFARIMPWNVASTVQCGDRVVITFELAANEQSRALDYDGFRLVYTLRIGRTLQLELAVYNEGETPLVFEEALHTYFAINDVTRATVDGLEGATYLDSTKQRISKQQLQSTLYFGHEVDSIYETSSSACTIHDPGYTRRILVEKSGSQTTVIWNPGSKVGDALPNLAIGEWRNFLCVETANALGNTITLAPGANHRMSTTITPLPE